MHLCNFQLPLKLMYPKQRPCLLEYKKIHRTHIENHNFLLSVFRDDIMVLCDALEKYFEIEDALKLYLHIDEDETRILEEYWDTPIVPYPFSQVMINSQNPLFH